MNDLRTYNCLIVDDEPLARKVIRDFCNEVDNIRIVAECSDAVKAMSYLHESLDIIYLDINMPKLSGLAFYESIPSEALVIFTTAYPDFAAQAFELEAFDYLVKPISFQRFIKSLDKVNRFFQQTISEQEWIKVKEGKRIYKVNAADIHYIQAYGDYVKIFTNEKVYVPKIKLIEFMETLPPSFLQVHRSYCIHLNAVAYIEGNQIVLQEGTKIPVSQTYKQALMSRL